MTNTRSFAGTENPGVFVILSAEDVICPLIGQLPARVSFSRKVVEFAGKTAP
ncbi:hypothetical protein [Phycobacter azelaicus]|uniref:hypothetical protein n=1 Tax=Phycobacter azelaicus TaxID=2668075 RepID=UPI00186740FD|nr:hypothetical protein [Phycobacter azelaicus]